MTRWADGLRSPDPNVRDEAAARIWERYSDRLLGLVRRRLSERVRRREDEDDVLQSMFHSFVRLQERAGPPLRSRDDLWRMLVHITLCKVANTAQRHHAACRDVRREAAGPGARSDDIGRFPDWLLELMDRSEPSPDEALALEEELWQWLAPLPEDLRRVALWRLEGYTNKEISDMIRRTERTVELKLGVIRGRLLERLAAAGADGPPP
jgi:RNA polymerase sigma factor (sigma-70 family)